MVLISVSQIFFAASKVEKTYHKVSVIHVTQPKLCPIQIAVSDIVDRTEQRATCINILPPPPPMRPKNEIRFSRNSYF